MSYLALYRKYRPQKFEEVVGQNKIVKILKNSINNNKISHAYLFSGPRGTGKTTTAKLIAKLVNCSNRTGLVACDKCDSCIAYNNKNNPDIIEIDAASNNGVDEIREIKEKVDLMPSISKYKVYIIDEVHMLSIGAFNALLKTLEEPPQHVIFILATTEFYKVPETIVSRCQCFNFEKISEKDIVKKLNEIVERENLDVPRGTLELIAKYSDGGLRDAINMLDKLISCNNKVTEDDFYEIRGLTKQEDLKIIVDCINNGNIKQMFDKIDDEDSKGKNLVLLAQELMIFLKDMLVDAIENNKNSILDAKVIYDAIDILNDVSINMKNSSFPKIILQVGLLKILEKNQKKENFGNSVPETLQKEEENTKNTKEDLVTPINLIKEKSIYVEDGKVKFEESKELNDKISKLSSVIEENRLIRINNAFAEADKNILETLRLNWPTINEYSFTEKYSKVCSYLNDGVLKVASNNYIIVSVKYSSILKNALINISKIEELLEDAMKHHYKIAFILEDEWKDLKQKYIQDLKNGIKYEIQQEKNLDDEKISDESSKNLDSNEMLDEAKDLFGDELIELK